MSTREELEQLSRTDLEKAALDNCCTCCVYELRDTIGETPEADLIRVALGECFAPEFLIEYTCPQCGNQWQEYYTCACDSECECGCRNIQADNWTPV